MRTAEIPPPLKVALVAYGAACTSCLFRVASDLARQCKVVECLSPLGGATALAATPAPSARLAMQAPPCGNLPKNPHGVINGQPMAQPHARTNSFSFFGFA